MKELITKFEQTGICEVDVDKVVKVWTDKFSISQYRHKFTLVKNSKKDNCEKTEISAEQANQIISRLNLVPIQSCLFVNGKTYRTASNILSEIVRISKIQEEKQAELNAISRYLYDYRQALYQQKHSEKLKRKRL